jgi:hypothetical protein
MTSLKNTLAAFACALLLAADASAQLPTMTVLVGPTRGERETNGPAFETDPLWSMGGGGGFRFGTGVLAIQPEVLIVSKGTKLVEANSESRLKLDYIELPVLAIITPTPQARIRPFVAAGPVLSLEMRCRVQFVSDNSKEEIGCDLSNAATFDRKKIDYSAAALAGVDYRMDGVRRISLQGRYTHGFRNISDAEDRELQIRNRAFSVYVGFTFPLQPDF